VDSSHEIKKLQKIAENNHISTASNSRKSRISTKFKTDIKAFYTKDNMSCYILFTCLVNCEVTAPFDYGQAWRSLLLNTKVLSDMRWIGHDRFDVIFSQFFAERIIQSAPAWNAQPCTRAVRHHEVLQGPWKNAQSAPQRDFVSSSTKFITFTPAPVAIERLKNLNYIRSRPSEWTTFPGTWAQKVAVHFSWWCVRLIVMVVVCVLF